MVADPAADRLKASVMLIVGSVETRVPAVQGKSLHNALLQRKAEREWPHERMEGHGFYTEAHVNEMYENVPAFLDRQIGAKQGAAGGR